MSCPVLEFLPFERQIHDGSIFLLQYLIHFLNQPLLDFLGVLHFLESLVLFEWILPFFDWLLFDLVLGKLVGSRLGDEVLCFLDRLFHIDQVLLEIWEAYLLFGLYLKTLSLTVPLDPRAPTFFEILLALGFVDSLSQYCVFLRELLVSRPEPLELLLS
jgi:hypothetical protein